MATKRRVFYSFHYKPDVWRTSQVRNAGVIEGNQPVSDNDWESITKGGDDAIKEWITGQLKGRTCAVVLIGSQTAGRKWITHEICEAWNSRKGIVGIYIHKLENQKGEQSTKGKNPFTYLKIGEKDASSIMKAYDLPRTTGKGAYSYITDHMTEWVEEAIEIRNQN